MQSDRSFPNAGMALVLTVGVVVLQIICSIPLEIAGTIYAAVTHRPTPHLTQHPLVLGIINILAFGGMIALGIRLARVPTREIFALRPVRPVLLLPILIGTLGATALLSEADNLFRYVFPMPEMIADFFRDLVSKEAGWWSPFFVMVLVAPTTEEVMFRGLVLRGLLTRHGVRTAVLISAALFALGHVNPWQLISAGGLGLLFGWWFYRTRSIVPGLIGHALVNGSALAVFQLPVEITGFNEGDPTAAVEFQPLWFDGLGLLMLASGTWLFHRLAPRPPPPPAVYDGPPPPFIEPPAATA